MRDRTSRIEGREKGWDGRSSRAVDEVDRRLLAELIRDGRMSIRTLADRVHISRANAYARVGRLLRDGVITGFTARIDPERAGLGTAAYVSVRIQQNTWREVSAQLRNIRYVEHVALVGGDYDVLVLVRAPDNAALRHVVLERIPGIPGVEASRTWLIFEELTGVGAQWT